MNIDSDEGMADGWKKAAAEMRSLASAMEEGRITTAVVYFETPEAVQTLFTGELGPAALGQANLHITTKIDDVFRRWRRDASQGTQH